MSKSKSAHYLAGFNAFPRGWDYALSIAPLERRALAEFIDGFNAAADA